MLKFTGSSAVSSISISCPSIIPKSGLTIGVDLGDLRSHYCILDSAGTVVGRDSVPTTMKAFWKFFKDHAGSRVVYEAGTHSKWVTVALDSVGCETIVANPRKVNLISKNNRKNDANDAELLARMGRADPQLLSPIKHRGLDNHAAQAVLRARDALVGVRTKLINCARGLVKPLGSRITSCSAKSFHKSAPDQIPEEMKEAIDPLIEILANLTQRITAYDKLVEEMSDTRFPETKILRQVTGVGALTGLAFALLIEDPARFARSRDVGPYLGLVPRQQNSGKQEPELSITKAGDSFARRLLVQSAHYILGPFGPDSDLRRKGKAIEASGRKKSKKRAAVAVARKLAVLLHSLWVTGEEYEPLRNTNRAANKKSA